MNVSKVQTQPKKIFTFSYPMLMTLIINFHEFCSQIIKQHIHCL